MAEIKDKKATERTRLETVIPLETPFELQLAVASICNFKCIFCPCSLKNEFRKKNFEKGIMDFKLYKKVIDDLDEFPEKIKILRLMREGEPLLNKKFPEMVRYAKKKQPTVRVDTTTNASLLTPELSDAIIDSGLDKIGISLQGMSAETCKRISGVDVDFEKLVENIIYFCKNRKNCKVFIKVNDIGVNESEREEFFRLFAQYADEMFIERIIPAWPNFDVSHVKEDDGLGYYGKPVLKTPVKICTIIFYRFVIDFIGNVNACLCDWEQKTNFGNVKDQSLYEIWNGKKFNDFRRMHLKGERRGNILCSKCKVLEYCEPDIVDDYAEMLLEKYKDLP